MTNARQNRSPERNFRLGLRDAYRIFLEREKRSSGPDAALEFAKIARASLAATTSERDIVLFLEGRLPFGFD